MRKPPNSILLTLPTQSNMLSALRLKPIVLIQVNRIHSTVLVLGPRAIYKHNLLQHTKLIHTFIMLSGAQEIVTHYKSICWFDYKYIICRVPAGFGSVLWDRDSLMHTATCPDSPSTVPRERVHELLERWDQGFKSAQNYIHTCTSCYVRTLTASLYAVG